MTKLSDRIGEYIFQVKPNFIPPDSVENIARLVGHKIYKIEL